MANANLQARFRLIDEMSQQLASIAESGQNMLEQWEQAANAINLALADIDATAVNTAGRIDGAADSVDNLQNSSQDVADSAQNLEDALADAADAADELGERAGEAADEAEEGSERVQNAASNLADALTAAGIALILDKIAEALLSASDAAAEFEAGIAQVSTIADPARASMEDIASGLLELSMDTGDAAVSLAEATYSAISASVDTAEAVAFTGTSTKLAAGGFTQAATAVDVLTTTLNAYGLEASEAGRIADMLITTQNLGKTTVDELAASVGKVIPIAAAYGVEMDNLSAAYAELTKGGIATAEAGTYLKAMLNELGDSGSAVSVALKEQTGQSFAKLTAQGYSLGDVLAVLGDSVNGDAGAFNELWSSSEAGVGALALYNAGAAQFNTTLDAMQNSLGATEAAYAIMNDTVLDSKEDLATAGENLQIVVGQSINPLMGQIYGLGTDTLNMFTQFASAHPVVVKAAAAVTIGLGAVAVVIGAVGAASVALNTAIPAIVAFGAAVNTALGPIGWAALAIGGLTVAVAAFVGMLDGAEEETAGMTAVTREQYFQLQNLNSEYEAACVQYGETSEEAARLKYQVDDLSAAFAANQQSVEQFLAEAEALCESAARISSDFAESQAAIGSAEVASLALIQKYADLAGQTELTAAQERALAAVSAELAENYPSLTAQLDEAALGAEDYAWAIKQLCRQQAEEARQKQAQDTYIAALQKQAELTEEIAKAQENLNLEQARLDDMSGWGRAWAKKDDLEVYQNALAELNAAMEENDALIAQIEQGWTDIANAEALAADRVQSWQEAASVAYEDVQAEIEALCAAYDAAYQAAFESFAGQFSLFDEADADMAATVANAQAALDSQLAYWESYQANVEVLKNTSAADLGITQANYEALMAYAQDGSAQAAGLAASMASAISSGNKEAVARLANTAEKVNAKQQEVAAATADWVTGFSAQMAEIEAEMQATVEEMNLSDEAAASATATIEAYTQQILAGKTGAVTAAKQVAGEVAEALANSEASVGLEVNFAGAADMVQAARAVGSFGNVGSIIGYANGTTNAEPAFIAGEEGPELILGRQGSTVFPTAETDRLLNALNRREQPLSILPDWGGGGQSTQPRQPAAEEKHIRLEIAGSGAIQLEGGRGADQESILSVLYEHIKPALLSIIQNEIFEEGELSYEY